MTQAVSAGLPPQERGEAVRGGGGAIEGGGATVSGRGAIEGVGLQWVEEGL